MTGRIEELLVIGSSLIFRLPRGILKPIAETRVIPAVKTKISIQNRFEKSLVGPNKARIHYFP